MRVVRVIFRVIIAVAAFAVVVLRAAAEAGLVGRRPDLEFWIVVLAGAWVCLESIGAVVQGAMRKKRVSSQRKIERVLIGAVVALSQNLGVPIEDLGANAFGVRRWTRPWWFTPRLIRLARFRPSDRLQASSVDWVRGKGAIGQAWKTQSHAHIKLIELAREWSASDMTEATFVSDFESRAMGLNFKEFRATTGKYAETTATVVTTDGGEVIGVVSFDRQLREDTVAYALDNQPTRDLLQITAASIRDLIPSSYALGQEETS